MSDPKTAALTVLASYLGAWSLATQHVLYGF